MDVQPNLPSYYPPSAQPPAAWAPPQPSALACTQCGSENVRTVPMVHAGGISNTTSKTSGTGVGLGRGGLGVGFGSATTHGVSQTQLSQSLAPPGAPSLFKRLLLVLVGAWLISGASSSVVGATLGGLVFLGALGGLGYWAWTNYVERRDEYRVAHDRWQKSFLCDRCGTVFVPAAMMPRQPDIVS